MNKAVTVIGSPVSGRYVKAGCDGTIDQDAEEIRVGGVWFDFDERWDVIDRLSPIPVKVTELQFERLKMSGGDIVFGRRSADEFFVSKNSLVKPAIKIE